MGSLPLSVILECENVLEWVSKAVRLCGGIYLGAQLCVLWNLRLVCFVGIMMDKHFAVAKAQGHGVTDYQAVIKNPIA